MSHINKLSIRNYRGIKQLSQDFGKERFIVLIGRGDSGKSTILSAIHAVLSPSWNLTFSDLDFYNQDTTQSIEIEVEISELPSELLTDKKYGLFVINDLSDDNCNESDLCIVVQLIVDETLEPHWVVKAKEGSGIEDKVISAQDRAMFAVNFITDYTDNQFAYNKLSPLYALTKNALGDSKPIDQVKSKLLRNMSQLVDSHNLEPLGEPLSELKTMAEKLGLTVGTLTPQIDIKENPYTGNSIALHDENLPYRLHGKGSKRLMSIAIQMSMASQGGIALIDEIEQGLEPDRIVMLTRIFKEISKGQVFITTHSMNVVLEATATNLFILNSGTNELAHVEAELDNCRRSNPQTFFGKKLIVCEGKTEYGFLRELDMKLDTKYNANFSTNGVVVVNAGGGDKMYTYALKLKKLGYEVCVFADNDVSAQMAKVIDAVKNNGIRLFLCEDGNCFEKEVIYSISWNAFCVLTQCEEIGFPCQHIRIAEDLKNRISLATSTQEQDKIREEILQKAIKDSKEWFKHIPGGEFLGSIVLDDIENIPNDNNLKKNIVELINWCGFGKN